jgi:hypothetical protein
MPEKGLTVARLREMARALELPLEDEDLTRLAPMVDDLVGEARRLRSYAPGAIVQLEHPGE